MRQSTVIAYIRIVLGSRSQSFSFQFDMGKTRGKEHCPHCNESVSYSTFRLDRWKNVFSDWKNVFSDWKNVFSDCDHMHQGMKLSMYQLAE